MKIADANIVLRYLLDDTEELVEKATEILENNEVLIPNEIIAEIVYVLEKVYRVNNEEISDTLNLLFQYENIEVVDLDVVEEALNLYSKRRLDFVDTLLYAYHKIRGYEVYTFDQVFIFRVQTPTSKRSVGGNFESGGVETPSDFPKFQLAETSSLEA